MSDTDTDEFYLYGPFTLDMIPLNPAFTYCKDRTERDKNLDYFCKCPYPQTEPTQIWQVYTNDDMSWQGNRIHATGSPYLYAVTGPNTFIFLQEEDAIA